jgi:hypothetical protein
VDDYTTTDAAYLHVHRDGEGEVYLRLVIEHLDGRVRDEIVRLYNLPSALEDACADACRLICGWAAWGPMGLNQVRESLTSYHG